MQSLKQLAFNRIVKDDIPIDRLPPVLKKPLIQQLSFYRDNKNQVTIEQIIEEAIKCHYLELMLTMNIPADTGMALCAKHGFEIGFFHYEKNDDEKDYNKYLANAAYSGYVDLFKYCLEKGANDYRKALSMACLNGRQQILQLIDLSQFTNDDLEITFKNLGYYGDWDFFLSFCEKLMLTRNIQYDEYGVEDNLKQLPVPSITFLGAAKNNKENFVKNLMKSRGIERYDENVQVFCVAAIKSHDNTKLTEWFINNSSYDYLAEYIQQAGISLRVETLKLLCHKSVPYTAIKLIQQAVERKDFQSLKRFIPRKHENDFAKAESTNDINLINKHIKVDLYVNIFYEKFQEGDFESLKEIFNDCYKMEIQDNIVKRRFDYFTNWANRILNEMDYESDHDRNFVTRWKTYYEERYEMMENTSKEIMVRHAFMDYINDLIKTEKYTNLQETFLDIIDNEINDAISNDDVDYFIDYAAENLATDTLLESLKRGDIILYKPEEWINMLVNILQNYELIDDEGNEECNEKRCKILDIMMKAGKIDEKEIIPHIIYGGFDYLLNHFIDQYDIDYKFELSYIRPQTTREKRSVDRCIELLKIREKI